MRDIIRHLNLWEKVQQLVIEVSFPGSRFQSLSGGLSDMSNVVHGTFFGGPVSKATYFPQVGLTTTSISTSLRKAIGWVYIWPFPL